MRLYKLGVFDFGGLCTGVVLSLEAIAAAIYCDGVATVFRHTLAIVSSDSVLLGGREGNRSQSETQGSDEVFQVEYAPHVTFKSSCCAVDPLTRSCEFVSFHLWLRCVEEDEATMFKEVSSAPVIATRRRD